MATRWLLCLISNHGHPINLLHIKHVGTTLILPSSSTTWSWPCSLPYFPKIPWVIKSVLVSITYEQHDHQAKITATIIAQACQWACAPGVFFLLFLYIFNQCIFTNRLCVGHHENVGCKFGMSQFVPGHTAESVDFPYRDFSNFTNGACDGNVTRWVLGPNARVNKWRPRSPSNFSGSRSWVSSLRFVYLFVLHQII